MNLARLLTRSATTFPDRPALLLGSRVLYDYREFARRAGALGYALTNIFGLPPGARLAVLAHNCAQYLEVLYGAWHAGLIVVPINAKLHPREVTHILRVSGAGALFTQESLLADLTAAATPLPALCVAMDGPAYPPLLQGPTRTPEHRAPSDTAWLFYTSGTTGQPKGVMQTHRNLLAMSLAYFTDVDAVEADDAILYAAPMSHGAGLYNFPYVLKAARHVVPVSGSFDETEIAALAPRVRQLGLFAAPTMVKRMTEHARRTAYDGDGINTIIYGGGPMYAADIRDAMTVLGPRFVQIYGQGECPMGITALGRDHLLDHSHPRHKERLVSVGVPQCNVEVRITGDDGTPLAAGLTGEIEVRGDTVMAGYWEDPVATAEALQNGWLRTGDVGECDADGFISLKDRSKDVVISGGSNIYPREVEEVLLLHPHVREVAVLGAPHPEWGEEVIAFIVLQPGQTPDPQSLDELCLAHIARFKRPRHYRFIAELPKNHYGKVPKTLLRTWWSTATDH